MKPITNKIITKFIAVSASLALVATGVTGCNQASTIDPNATVVNINNGEATVSLGYANFVAKYQQSMYDMYYSTDGSNIWEEEPEGSEPSLEETVKENSLEGIKTDYLAKIHAAEYGVEITEDDNVAIGEAADKFMDSNSQEALEALGATREYVVEFLTDNTYLTRVANAIQDETEITATEEEAARTTFSYVHFTAHDLDTEEEAAEEHDHENEELSAEDRAALSLEAQTLVDAEDFNARLAELGKELESYTFATYSDPADDFTMGEQIIRAALNLNDGDVSPVLMADDGYYVLRMDKYYDEDESQTAYNNLVNGQKTDHYNEVMDGWKDELVWEVDEALWSKVRFTKLFKLSSAAYETEDEGDVVETEAIDEEQAALEEAAIDEALLQEALEKQEQELGNPEAQEENTEEAPQPTDENTENTDNTENAENATEGNTTNTEE